MYCVHNCQDPEYVPCLEQKSTRRGKTHRNTNQLWLNLTNRKTAYWRKMAWVWWFSCILLNTIYLLGSSTSRAVAFSLCKYYCYACEEINSLKQKNTDSKEQYRFFLFTCAFLLSDYHGQHFRFSFACVFVPCFSLGCFFLSSSFLNDFSQNSLN